MTSSSKETGLLLRVEQAEEKQKQVELETDVRVGAGVLALPRAGVAARRVDLEGRPLRCFAEKVKARGAFFFFLFIFIILSFRLCSNRSDSSSSNSSRSGGSIIINSNTASGSSSNNNTCGYGNSGNIIITSAKEVMFLIASDSLIFG